MSINEEYENIGNCYSKLAQCVFYWLASSVSRAAFLGFVDSKRETQDTFIFSLEEPRPKLHIGSFSKLFMMDTIYWENEKKNYSVGNFLRDGWRAALRMDVILKSQAIIEYYIEKNSPAAKKELLVLHPFIFLKEARVAIAHTQGKMSRYGHQAKEVVIPDLVSLNTASGKELKLSDSKLYKVLFMVLDEIEKYYKSLGGEVDAVSEIIVKASRGIKL